MTDRIIPNGAHVWATVEYPTSSRTHTVNAAVESHSTSKDGLLRYRVRDHETGGVYIVAAPYVRCMS